MKSLFKFSFFTLMVIMTTLVACNKAENGLQPENAAAQPDQTQQSLAVKPIRIFRLDGNDVPRGTFSVDDPTRNIFLEEQANNVLVINGFTSQEAYFQYGDNNGYNLRLAQKIEDHLAAYAESSGAIAEQEATGAIPKWWNQYFEDYMRTQLRASTPLLTRSITTDLWENTDAGGRNYTLVSMFGLHAQQPWLWLWGMDDKTSSYHPAQLFGSIETAFDRSWFRKKMFVRSKARLASGYTINLDGDLAPFNDRAGSWLTLGL